MCPDYALAAFSSEPRRIIYQQAVYNHCAAKFDRCSSIWCATYSLPPKHFRWAHACVEPTIVPMVFHLPYSEGARDKALGKRLFCVMQLLRSCSERSNILLTSQICYHLESTLTLVTSLGCQCNWTDFRTKLDVLLQWLVYAKVTPSVKSLLCRKVCWKHLLFMEVLSCQDPKALT